MMRRNVFDRFRSSLLAESSCNRPGNVDTTHIGRGMCADTDGPHYGPNNTS